MIHPPALHPPICDNTDITFRASDLKVKAIQRLSAIMKQALDQENHTLRKGRFVKNVHQDRLYPKKKTPSTVRFSHLRRMWYPSGRIIITKESPDASRAMQRYVIRYKGT
jgi:hypothetical protein